PRRDRLPHWWPRREGGRPRARSAPTGRHAGAPRSHVARSRPGRSPRPALSDRGRPHVGGHVRPRTGPVAGWPSCHGHGTVRCVKTVALVVVSMVAALMLAAPAVAGGRPLSVG